MVDAFHSLSDLHNGSLGIRPAVRISGHAIKPNAANWAAILRPGRQDGLDDRCTFEHAVAHHLAAGLPCAVLLFNIDGLSHINDKFGDTIGDDVVSQFGDRLRRVEPLAKSVAGLGGDDFAMLLAGMNAPFDADEIALRITRVLESPFYICGGALLVSASIGIAHAPLHGHDATNLIGAAAGALRAAKTAGGHVWRIADAATGPVISGGLAEPDATAKTLCGTMDTGRHYADATVLRREATTADCNKPTLRNVLATAIAGGSRAVSRAATVGLSAGIGVALALMLSSHAGAATIEFGAPGKPLDPIFNLPYDPAAVRFESVEASKFQDCAPLLGAIGHGSRQTKLFGKLVTGRGVVVILGDEDPGAPRGLTGTVFVMRNGGCRTSGPLFALRRTRVDDPDLDPGLSASDVSGLLQDVLSRYAHAFGSKAMFLTWVDRLTEQGNNAYNTTPDMPCPLLFTKLFTPAMLAEMTAFRRS